jgi:glycosyltransferase involved in cell wall biosynthesis
MKVLQVIEATLAGVGRHVRSLCEYLIDQNHQLTVAYAPHRMDDQFRQFVADYQNEIRFVSLNIKRKVSPISDLLAVVRLLRLIRLEGPFDITHGHSAKGGAIARVAGSLSGVPTVYTPHALISASPEVSKTKAYVYNLIERILGHSVTSKMIAVSEGEYEFILKLGLISDARIVLIKNGIDDEDIEYFAARTPCKDLSSKPLTLGSTMRFTAQKAPDHLVEAFIGVCAALPQVPMRLVIAGDGELLREVKRQAESSGLGERISFLGWQADIKAVLQNIDVFVMSSLYEAGLPYSIMEAMAAKLPVISTNVFGTKGPLSQIPGNIVVPVGSPRTLAHGIEQMVTLTSYRSLGQSLGKIGQANHDYVHVHFRQSNSNSRTIKVYQELCLQRSS